MIRILLTIVVLATLSACSQKLKEKVGIVTPGPNEYQVNRNKSLEIPPHYQLPKPAEATNKDKKQHTKSPSKANLSEAEKGLLEDIDNPTKNP